MAAIVCVAGLVIAKSIAHSSAAAGQLSPDVWASDFTDSAATGALDWKADPWADPAQFMQPVAPRLEAPTAVPLGTTSQRASQQFWTSFGANATASSARAPRSGSDLVTGQESVVRASTDMGDLLGTAPSVINLGIQRRNPIVNDPRVRGSRVGSLAASGSYWVPARLDLDTMVSKIDSRIIDNVITVPGPYSALYGPGLDFVDFELEGTPRFNNGFEAHGRSSVDYRTNGEQWYGRQTVLGGDDLWGFRAGYGHRTGSDYLSGDGTQIPSSYKSRDIDLALGGQLTDTHALETQALRLDQTDVELAGQAFDIDWLVTDGYELSYTVDSPQWADRVLVEGWYNRTRLEGSAQRPSKRAQFPFYDVLSFSGFTDVDSMSTGYRLISHWDGIDDERLSLGADLRYIKQEVNEITSGIGDFIWNDQNSPIPRSYWSNPGLLAELVTPVSDQATITVGGRVDYVATNVIDDPAKLAAVGIDSELAPVSAADIWGTDEIKQNDLVGLGFVSLDAEDDDGWGAGAKVGYGERAPNVTERYALETFMFLIQNGLNTVTGDPTLEKERLLQTDISFSRHTDRFRGDVVGFYGWAHNYITFEALQGVPGPPSGDIEQLNLKYVNTELATLWGWEARAEYDFSDMLTPFATIKYVEGDDRTRNGSFDTVPADPGSPSTRVAGVPRGTNSMLTAPLTDQEPLPGILPLESRLGVRVEEPAARPRWGTELSARIVDNQDRVAASLLESPTPGFTVWDLRGYFRPIGPLLLVGGVENFTDKQYREHLDFRSTRGLAVYRSGINFYFGSELSY